MSDTRRILKFELDPVTRIETADEPRFRAVGWQGDTLVAWCEATPGTGVSTVLKAATTGASIPAGTYIGTTQHPTLNGGGPLVVHVYLET